MKNISKSSKQKKQPGEEYKMKPRPRYKNPSSSNPLKLENKIAIITGGDSGIGRAVAVAFAKEGAHIAILYLNEHIDARETEKAILQEGRDCILIPCNLGIESEVKEAVRQVVKRFKTVDILVNNAAEQHSQESLLEITEQQLEKTFRTNIFSYFFMTKAVLPYLKKGSTIVNTTSVTAYRGSKHLLDYASTKGAIVAFTRSLASNLVEKGIRVNGVAPGPIWTPLISSTFSVKRIKEFGEKVPMKRPGQPEEVAPSFVFLASDDSSYMTGQILHPNGGEIING